MNWTLVALGMTIGIATGAVLRTALGHSGLGVGFGLGSGLVFGLALQLIGREAQGDSVERP
jgi:hypothetical protein